ncbi:MAG: hypothetical protein FWG74_04325 [Planctomycetes bacterium]|nr:hypothetical protein [Planctomycetota bacterium]
MRDKWVGQAAIAAVLGITLLLPVLSGATASLALNPAQRELLDRFLSFAPPEGHDGGPWMLDKWDLDAGLGLFIVLPSGGGNAAAAFRRLEELFPSEMKDLEVDGSGTRGVQALLEAAEMRECRLAPDYYPEFDRITVRQPDFVILRSYLKALQDRAVRSERAGDVLDAELCHRAAIICGRHLTSDRSSVLTYLTGLIFKLRGGQEYEKFLRRLGRTAEADLVRDFTARIGVLMRAFNWKANEALNRMDAFASLPVAVRVAIDDKESCWRKEALFRLGLFRFGVVAKDSPVVRRELAFEAEAERVLGQAAAMDPDPSVRRFAVWVVQNVKPDNYADMEHKFE